VACVNGTNGTRDTTTRRDESNDIPIIRTNLIALIRRLSFRRSKILRSLAYAAAYSSLSSLSNSLASTISSAHTWLACTDITTSILLEGLHSQWTQAIIVPKTTPTKGILTYPWRGNLFLPTAVYALARKATTELPLLISPGSTDPDFNAPADAVAIKSMARLMLAFALRFFVLYPVWASLICFETAGCNERSAQDTTTEVRTITIKQDFRRYWKTARLCYQRVVLRLAGLHLQAAGVLISIEAVVYMLMMMLSTRST